MTSKKKEKKEREKQEVKILKGKCLRCGKPMVKNHKSCKACNRRDRLKSKANRRGRKKDYYLRT
jgi:uncharacterized OB-fold protein